jgi:hypothetical protein
MGFEVRKTDHAGAKNGGGAWCCRAVAKAESSRVRRRVDDPAAVAEAAEDYNVGADARHQSPARSSQRLPGELPFMGR